MTNSPLVDFNTLTRVWHEFYVQVSGNPSTPMTRSKLHGFLGGDMNFHPDQTLGCLKCFHDQKLIKCIKGDEEITATKDPDYDKFRITVYGVAMGENYKLPKL